MKEVEKILNDYDCKVISKKNIGSYLDYNEIDVRLLLLNYCCAGFTVDNINKKYLNVSEDVIYSIRIEIEKFLKINNYNVTNNLMEEILKYILIMVYRVKNGYIINHIAKKHDIINNIDYLLPYTNKMAEIINFYFGIEINKNGRLYLSIPFLTRNAAITDSLALQDIDVFIADIVDSIWYDIYEDMGIIITDKELLRNLSLHLSYSINRIVFNVAVKNPLKRDIKNKYNFAYKLAKIASKSIENKIGSKVSEDEISFIAMHFSVFLENNKSKISELRNFALICENGLGTSMLLKARLKRILKFNSNIEVYSYYDLYDMNLSKYDVLFTTVNLSKEILCSFSKPVIKIDNIFDEKELLVLLENAVYSTNNNSKGDFLSQFISDDNIHIYNTGNYEDLLLDMLKKLKINEIVDSEFCDYIINREKINPTIYDNGIMLPHYVSPYIEYPVISMGLVKHKCIHNKKLLKWIIMVVYPKEGLIDSDLLIKLYDDVIDLGQDLNVINSISSVTSISEFKNIIRR